MPERIDAAIERKRVLRRPIECVEELIEEILEGDAPTAALAPSR